MSDIFPNVLDIVRSVRPMLLPYWGKIGALEYKPEQHNSPVTQLDRDVEAYLSKQLAALDSSIAFVGEEGGGDRTKERFWLADPIDGTAGFIEGLPLCTTMLALIENDEPRFAAIYDFVTDEMYHAEKGKGTYQNDSPVAIGSKTSKDAKIIIESQFDTDEHLQIRERARTQYQLLDSRFAGHDFIMLVTGQIDARVCINPWGQDYDFVPGAFLAEEAGGVVANIGATTYDYKNLDFIAAGKPMFASLTEGPDAIFPIQ